MSSVRIGCMNIVKNEGELDGTVEGSLFIDLHERHQIQPAKYIVQWKQRIYSKGKMDESGWITASVRF